MEVKIISKRAIDITPHRHGLYFSIQNGEPFVNPIVIRKWSEDRTKIHFMLDTHNFFSAYPYEVVDSIVETKPLYNNELMEQCDMRDSQEFPQSTGYFHEKGTQMVWLARRFLFRLWRRRSK